MIHHKQQQASSSSESGFTIIESLVAIIVASILLSAIAPVIVLSVATRVQAKRIETATDAAKSYIEGIRSGGITSLPPVTSTRPSPCDSNIDNLKAVISCIPAPPTGTLTCPTPTAGSISECSVVPSPTDFKLYCMNVDGNGCSNSTNGNKNFIIQASGYNPVSTATAEGYILGVRVYRVDGFTSDGGDLKKAPSKQNTFAAGVGDRKSPLIEMTTEITNTSTTFENICNRLKDAGNSNSNQLCN